MNSVVAIGECMIELARRDDGAFTMRVGGDTFNTAIYLARLGSPVHYMTAVGDDPYSQLIVETAEAEGVGRETILAVPGRMPGLYLIETKQGERAFYYWRDLSPARELFELAGSDRLIAALQGTDTAYLSGVTLSLYSTDGLDRLAAALEAIRARGGRVVLDSNYRPIGWRHERDRAQATFKRFWGLADIALPSFDDEQALWGDETPDVTATRLEAFGAGEICIKDGARGAYVGVADDLVHLAAQTTAQPVDTTAAGDAFNAAYVHARLTGQAAIDAARLGQALAAIVIQHPGAIAPRAAMTSISRT